MRRQDKTKSELIYKGLFQKTMVKLSTSLLLLLVRNLWKNLKVVLLKVTQTIFNPDVFLKLWAEKSVAIVPKFFGHGNSCLESRIV